MPYESAVPAAAENRYLIKEQKCVREFKLSPISYHLFEYLIEEYAKAGQEIPYAV